MIVKKMFYNLFFNFEILFDMIGFDDQRHILFYVNINLSVHRVKLHKNYNNFFHKYVRD